ncbi:uncharacterized protein BJ212DRAFT_1305548 [Suillus subaureus]|uniref:Cytochrome P450 n=1 Tax=Suillus subaureus TaxID=48587 RepID=A0A9P7DNZ4_9AGAM|nr:uncharacterized protein BJ212DRAFT_1305548 [Suillus subaureus]KAG1799498.1 hypothetical protein BJ212DRAFT_1305548 [Suillus subaureus]
MISTGEEHPLSHGRRICPGHWSAENSLWIAAATLLAVLRIDHAKDSNGNRIEVKLEFNTCLAIERGTSSRDDKFKSALYGYGCEEIENQAQDRDRRAQTSSVVP